jgi:CRISPR-associated protein Cmr6
VQELWKKAKPPANQTVRHASPVHLHATAAPKGFVIRAVAFVAPFLPNEVASRHYLTSFLTKFRQELETRAKLAPLRAAPPPPPTVPNLPTPGQSVQAELLPEKTKKGGWKARHLSSGIDGPIQNSGPSAATVGQIVDLIVKSANAREIAFAWPPTPKGK